MHFTEHKGLLPSSQKPAAGPNPEWNPIHSLTPNLFNAAQLSSRITHDLRPHKSLVSYVKFQMHIK